MTIDATDHWNPPPLINLAYGKLIKLEKRSDDRIEPSCPLDGKCGGCQIGHLSQLRQKPDDYIDVDVDVAELEGTSAETKATYEKIKKYVAEHNGGMKVSNLYIAQVKRKCGLELAENFNLPKSEDSRQPQCPKEKEEAIVEALKAFQMV